MLGECWMQTFFKLLQRGDGRGAFVIAGYVHAFCWLFSVKKKGQRVRSERNKVGMIGLEAADGGIRLFCGLSCKLLN